MLKVIRTMLIVILNIVLYGLVVFGAVALCYKGYDFSYATVGDTSKDLPPGRDVPFVIDEKESEFEVASHLAESELVRDRYSFFLRMQLEKSEGVHMQHGVFLLNSSMTYDDIRRVIYS